MIHISLKDKELEARPEVRKWLDDCEKIINEKLPEEKLRKIKEEWDYCYATGMPFCIDADGNVTGLYEKIYGYHKTTG